MLSQHLWHGHCILDYHVMLWLSGTARLAQAWVAETPISRIRMLYVSFCRKPRDREHVADMQLQITPN